MKTTTAFARCRLRAISSASSARLARVQSHCGWANITSVGRTVSGVMRLCAGHRAGATAVGPGRLAKAAIIARPATTLPSQVSPSAVHNHRFTLLLTVTTFS